MHVCANKKNKSPCHLARDVMMQKKSETSCAPLFLLVYTCAGLDVARRRSERGEQVSRVVPHPPTTSHFPPAGHFPASFSPPPPPPLRMHTNVVASPVVTNRNCLSSPWDNRHLRKNPFSSFTHQPQWLPLSSSRGRVISAFPPPLKVNVKYLAWNGIQQKIILSQSNVAAEQMRSKLTLIRRHFFTAALFRAPKR